MDGTRVLVGLADEGAISSNLAAFHQESMPTHEALPLIALPTSVQNVGDDYTKLTKLRAWHARYDKRQAKSQLKQERRRLQDQAERRHTVIFEQNKEIIRNQKVQQMILTMPNGPPNTPDGGMWEHVVHRKKIRLWICSCYGTPSYDLVYTSGMQRFWADGRKYLR